MKKPLLIGLVISTTLFVLSGCNSFVTEKEYEESISVKKDKAKALDVELNLGIGEINVQKGAEEWVDGNAIYNLKKLKPQVSYDLHRDIGEVVIEHEDQKRFRISEIKNEWDIKITDKIPLSLSIETGATMANLDLKGLKLESLDIETGVGDIAIDLGGDWETSFETNIETGVGQTTVYLPSEVGVKITIEKGIGSSDVVGFISKGDNVYVNEAYEGADVILTVSAEMGVGEISFELDK